MGDDKLNIDQTDQWPEEVETAKKKGSVLELTGEDGKKYYFRKPGASEMNRYLGAAAKGKLANAAKNLVVDLAIYPKSDDLRKKINDNPGLMVALSNALQNAVGINEEFEVKKL